MISLAGSLHWSRQQRQRKISVMWIKHRGSGISGQAWGCGEFRQPQYKHKEALSLSDNCTVSTVLITFQSLTCYTLALTHTAPRPPALPSSWCGVAREAALILSDALLSPYFTLLYDLRSCTTIPCSRALLLNIRTLFAASVGACLPLPSLTQPGTPAQLPIPLC